MASTGEPNAVKEKNCGQKAVGFQSYPKEQLWHIVSYFAIRVLDLWNVLFKCLQENKEITCKPNIFSLNFYYVKQSFTI